MLDDLRDRLNDEEREGDDDHRLDRITRESTRVGADLTLGPGARHVVVAEVDPHPAERQ